MTAFSLAIWYFDHTVFNHSLDLWFWNSWKFLKL